MTNIKCNFPIKRIFPILKSTRQRTRQCVRRYWQTKYCSHAYKQNTRHDIPKIRNLASCWLSRNICFQFSKLGLNKYMCLTFFFESLKRLVPRSSPPQTYLILTAGTNNENALDYRSKCLNQNILLLAL